MTEAQFNALLALMRAYYANPDNAVLIGNAEHDARKVLVTQTRQRLPKYLTDKE